MPALVAGIVRSQARSVQGGANPHQVNLLRPVANRNCVAVRRGGKQRKANGAVRNASKLDSATLTGEPAMQRRSLYLCEQEAHDAEGLGAKAVMGGSGVVGDGRLWRDRTREARRPARRKRRKDSRYRPPQGAERVSESRLRAGVTALVVAMKPGNAGGAKGCRKVETWSLVHAERYRQHCLPG